ncbi:MAG: DEAD/DEAH box helicase [Planctomycetes bacterium]|nr:DEAD/DEAH box helicase [Planctomycetota bacterium]
MLSGTPAPNDRSEYWAQMNFIAPNTVFSDNFFAFRSRYFTAVPLGRTGINLWKFTKNPSLTAEFNDRMLPVCDVVRKQDAVDLPPQTHEIRKVELSKDERAAYQTFRDELVLRFASEEVLASSALVEIMKARQLTSGFCYGQNSAHQTGKSKLNELLSLLDEIGNKPVIVWCNFRQEIETLLDILPDSAALWSGTADRQEVINGFKDGTYRYLVANPQSAGHGLTFTHCSDAVYFSLAYSYELLKQSQDRIHRIGQDSKCTYYYLIAKDSIDEVVCKAVREKKKLSESVLQYLNVPSGT